MQHTCDSSKISEHVLIRLLEAKQPLFCVLALVSLSAGSLCRHKSCTSYVCIYIYIYIYIVWHSMEVAPLAASR